MIICFVDIGGIVNHHCLNFIFIKIIPNFHLITTNTINTDVNLQLFLPLVLELDFL